MIRHSAYGAKHNKPDMIVVHAMGEYIESSDGETYLGAADMLDSIGLSAHALVSPDGSVCRLRNDDEGAFHAGGFNTNSLGIEVLVPGNHNYGTFLNAIARPYMTPAQYDAVVAQCRKWMRLYRIKRIVRHSDLSPVRKLDPGDGFPWGQFLIDVMKKE